VASNNPSEHDPRLSERYRERYRLSERYRERYRLSPSVVLGNTPSTERSFVFDRAT